MMKMRNAVCVCVGVFQRVEIPASCPSRSARDQLKVLGTAGTKELGLTVMIWRVQSQA